MNIAYCKKQIERLVKEKQIQDMAAHIRDEDKPYIIHKADELLDKTFTFDKAWDMERCTIPYHFDYMDWNAQRNDDEEWCFMLNRMDYLNYLILAGVVTKEKKYYTMCKKLQLDWITQHPIMKQEPSTRTLDTGIRIMNMMETLPYLYAANIVNEEELNIIIDSISLQIQYLKEEYVTKYTLSNWGSIQTCAIVSCIPLYDEKYKDNLIFKWAKKELKIQFDIQVYEDGMHWEQSTMYHIEVLNYGMKALFYQRIYHYDLDDSISDQIKKLCNALCYQVTPRNEIETFGDSDRVCICDVFTRAVSLFGNIEWKYIANLTYDYESLYCFGCAYANLYKKINVQAPAILTYDGQDSGMFAIRSKWGETANFTMFTNGSLGSGHGHSDNLHVSIYREGVPVLIDPGRYTYREDHPLRVELKKMKSHNSVIIDDKECSLPSDSWGYHDFGIPLKNYVRHTSKMHYLEGAYIGHQPLQVWIRKVIVLNCGIWLIVDEVKADGKRTESKNHVMKSYFHADPAMALHTASDVNGYELLTEDNTISMKIIGEGVVDRTQKPCSLRYNELLEHTVITFTKEFENETSSVTYLCDSNVKVQRVDIFQNGEVPVSKELAEAYRFYISANESYTIAIFHKEIFKGKKICYCEGIPFHAKCIVIHEVDGNKEITRLRA